MLWLTVQYSKLALVAYFGYVIFKIRKLSPASLMNMNNMTSTAKKFVVDKNVKVKFKDVAGMDEAKLEI